MIHASLPRRLAFALGGIVLVASACGRAHPLAPTAEPAEGRAASAVAPTAGHGHGAAPATEQACWGQATKVFAHTGEMGAHASSYPSPRLGLRNLARALHEAGVLPDDSMRSLAAFVLVSSGLSLDACTSG